MFCSLFVSRCSFVFVVLLVLWFCFESQYFIFILHLVFLLFFVFVALAFIFLNCGYLWKISLKHLKIPKTPNMKNAETNKRTFWQEQLTEVCSQIVFFSLFVSLKFACFAESTIYIVASTNKHKKWQIFKVTNRSKSKLKTGPSMLRNKIGPIFNLKMVFFVIVFAVLKIDFQKQKKTWTNS